LRIFIKHPSPWSGYGTPEPDARGWYSTTPN
jgi:hypothetical protein